jgi:hypothetical protein
MAPLRTAICLLFAGLLAACGDHDDPQTPPTPALTALSYPTPPVLTVGTMIDPLVPTVTGSPTSYAITPVLPAGLNLNSSTGVISGTPTATQVTTHHTVTASNQGSLVTITISFTVRDASPSISYARSTYTFAVDVPVRVSDPDSNGGAVETWSVDPALPAGLSLDTASGRITGTPTTLAAPAAHIVTATNGTGSDTFGMTLGVISGELVDLDHVTAIGSIQYGNSRILSIDADRRAVLWNAQTGARIRAFDSDCDASCGATAALAAQTVVVRNQNGFDVYAAADGALMAHVNEAATSASSWNLSVDGNYFVVCNSSRLAAWSNAGSMLFARAGNYGNAVAVSKPAEVRVALGAQGANVIETIDVATGGAMISPAFAGTFHSWFNDGERFFATESPRLYVYSPAAAQQFDIYLPDPQLLGGHGEWIWNRAIGGSQLQISPIGMSPTLVENIGTGQRVHASGGTLALLSTFGEPIVIVDLSVPGYIPPRTEIATPNGWLSAFAAQSSTDWIVGTAYGVVVKNAPAGAARALSYGAASSIAASSRRIAVATASGRILNFDAQTRTLEHEIEFSSGKVLLSADGNVLGATSDSLGWQYPRGKTLRLYALPSLDVLLNLPLTNYENDFVMSAAGDRLGLSYLFRVSSNPGFARHHLLESDGTQIWQGQSITQDAPVTTVPLRLAPSGMRFAMAERPAGPLAETEIFLNGASTGRLTAWPAGWLDDSRLLVNRYDTGDPTTRRFLGAEIVDVSGQRLATTTLPELDAPQTAGVNLVYSADQNLIFDVTTGAVVWSSPNPSRQIGAANDEFVFFASDTTVRLEPR